MNPRIPSSALFLACTLLAWMAAGCSARLEDTEPEGCPLSLAVKSVGIHPDATKTYASITQSDGSFRGIERVNIIPFNTASATVQPADKRLGSHNVRIANAEIVSSGLVLNNNAHYFDNAVMPSGMNRVLVYGKAMDNGDVETRQGRHLNGVLNAEGLSDPTSAGDISFSLEPILDPDAGDQTEIVQHIDNILEQLNNIVSLIRDTGNEGITEIFNTIKHDRMILGCNYQVFNQMRQDILTALNRLPFDISLMDMRKDIVAAVNQFSDALRDAGGADFP